MSIWHGALQQRHGLYLGTDTFSNKVGRGLKLQLPGATASGVLLRGRWDVGWGTGSQALRHKKFTNEEELSRKKREKRRPWRKKKKRKGEGSLRKVNEEEEKEEEGRRRQLRRTLASDHIQGWLCQTSLGLGWFSWACSRGRNCSGKRGQWEDPGAWHTCRSGGPGWVPASLQFALHMAPCVPHRVAWARAPQAETSRMRSVSPFHSWPLKPWPAPPPHWPPCLLLRSLGSQGCPG